MGKELREDKEGGNHVDEDVAVEEGMTMEDTARVARRHMAAHPQLTVPHSA